MLQQSRGELGDWARALGLRLEHVDGCEGVVLPGVAVLIRPDLPACEEARRIGVLLRAYGAKHTPG